MNQYFIQAPQVMRNVDTTSFEFASHLVLITCFVLSEKWATRIIPIVAWTCAELRNAIIIKWECNLLPSEVIYIL
jgi:hypothetical protein